MQDPAKRKKLYEILTYVFAIAGLVWIIGGVWPPRLHYFLYPFLGLLNWAVAWYCKQMSQTG
jgi:hypothetical protein